jgi:hypothetical protein
VTNQYIVSSLLLEKFFIEFQLRQNDVRILEQCVARIAAFSVFQVHKIFDSVFDDFSKILNERKSIVANGIVIFLTIKMTKNGELKWVFVG